jgi:hypothetical protein
MDLLLTSLAGSRTPIGQTIGQALRDQRWLVTRRRAWGGPYEFTGGTLEIVAGRPSPPPYAAPWLVAHLGPTARFDRVAPRLALLAGQLHLGIDTPRSGGALWWEAPDPTATDPGDVDRAVGVCRSCDPWEAWPLLGFALASRECLELAESHPALALLLAHSRRLRGRHRAGIPAGERARFLREVARARRRDILSWLGFPATGSMLRLLRKVAPGGLSLEALQLLRDLPLAPDAERTLRHLPRFGGGLIQIAVRRRLWSHMGPQLVREAAEETDEWDVFHLLRDVLGMAESLGCAGDIGVIPSRAVLVRQHDQLRAEYAERPRRNLRVAARRAAEVRAGEAQAAQARAAARAAAPPKPPRRIRLKPPEPTEPPPDGVVRLTTPEELRKEGTEMDNCVASYERAVAKGDLLVYRVLRPERATLALRWNGSRGVWKIDQMKGPANRSVRRETRQGIREWLETGAPGRQP